MRLSIVIPAYDEEDAIEATSRACLEAAPRIASEAGLDSVEVIVVDDGSRDRTAEIVARIAGVRLVRHEKNRGYGAALKTGFAAASGDLLGFLDADGTCAPAEFGRLTRALLDRGADVVSGSRLGPGNRMPPVRRLGNRLFAFFINRLSPQPVEDVASGMRVLRKSAVRKLAPLPDGMHFTPAMSAKALFDSSLKMIEEPIPYSERVGRSKLSVLKDGQRFLKVLTETALSYRPFRFFGSIGLFLLLVAFAYGIQPAHHLLAGEGLSDRMIYRVLTIVCLTAAGLSLVITGLVAEEATAIIHGRRARLHPLHRACAALLMSRPVALGLLLVLGALALDRHAIAQYLRHFEIEEHWIVVVGGGLMVLIAIQLFSFAALRRILTMLAERHRARDGADGDGRAD